MRLLCLQYIFSGIAISSRVSCSCGIISFSYLISNMNDMNESEMSTPSTTYFCVLRNDTHRSRLYFTSKLTKNTIYRWAEQSTFSHSDLDLYSAAVAQFNATSFYMFAVTCRYQYLFFLLTKPSTKAPLRMLKHDGSKNHWLSIETESWSSRLPIWTGLSVITKRF